MAGSHSTPPLQTAPIQPHHGRAEYLSPKMLVTTFDLPLPPMRRSPSPMSPSGIESFVTKAKAMLRGRRGSVQVTESDIVASGKLATQSHYQTHSTRPTPHRQSTAPLPLVASKSFRRPPLKRSDGSYSISNPITSNTEATYKYCELIDTADMAARTAALLSPRENIVRSPSPSVNSDDASPGCSSGSAHQTSRAQQNGSHRTIHNTTIVKSSRPKSDVFPLSVTESTIRSKSDYSTGFEGQTPTPFDGYESHSRDSSPDSRVPFELDCATPDKSHNLRHSSVLHGLGLGMSDTMMAIRTSGMLYPEEDATQGLGHGLGKMFLDAVDRGQDTESNVLAWLGLGAGIYSGNYAEDDERRGRSGHFDFAEDALSLPMRAPRRPMGIARGLESVTAGGPEFLLTDWRAELDSSCNFTLCPVNAQSCVHVIADDIRTLGEGISGSVEPFRAIPRSRSKTMPSTRVPPRPSVLIPPSLWDPVSAPASPSLSGNPHCVASGSRTPSIRRRNTRDMFDLQVSHATKASRSARRPAACRLEIIDVDAEEENSADWILVSPRPSRLPEPQGRRTLYMSPPQDSLHLLRQRQTVARMNRLHVTRIRMGTAAPRPPSERSGMIKSPSVGSGLGKPTSKRRARMSPSRRSHSRTQLPASSSTRSLPGSSNSESAMPASRRRTRLGKPKRRHAAEKENVPVVIQRNEGLSAPHRYPTALHCPRVETDALCAPVETFAAGTANGRRSPAPAVPPRNPARPRTYSQI